MTKTTATLAVLAVLAWGQARGAAAQNTPLTPAGADLQVMKVQGNVWMIAGPGGNTTVFAGDNGVFIVDTQVAAVSDKLLAAIRSISPKAIHYI
ncbi:MAG: hypothetical protein AAB289_17080, partial [Chloroflexota bacterium]